MKEMPVVPGNQSSRCSHPWGTLGSRTKGRRPSSPAVPWLGFSPCLLTGVS